LPSSASSPSLPSTASNPSSPSQSFTRTTRRAAQTAETHPSPIVAEEVSLPPPRPKRSVVSYFLITLGFAGVVAALTVGLLSMNQAPSNADRSTIDEPSTTPFTTGRRSSTPSAAPTAAAPEEDLVEVSVHASPPIAELWIDDVRVGQGPHT